MADKPKHATRVRTLSGFNVEVVPGARERNALAIAARQRGRITRRQLLAAGWTAQSIRTAVGRAWLRRVARGVYAIGPEIEIPLTRQTEALLAVGNGAALVGVSVLAALGLIPDSPREPIHVTIAEGRRARNRPGIVVHSRSRLTATELRTLQGLPMTTVEQALLDAVPHLTRRQLERALDEAVAGPLTSRTKVRELLARSEPCPGRPLLHVLVDERRPGSRTESDPAEAALQLIRRAGLPDPVTEENLLGFRADNYWPEAGVVLEVDSFTFHGLIRANFNRDRRKDRVYTQNGILVVRWSDDDISERPLELVAQLGMTIATRLTERAAARQHAV